MIPDTLPANDAAIAPITRRGEWRTGLHLTLPVLPGIGVWGVVSGVAMIKAGLTLPQAVTMTFLVYAGSAQLACLPLMAVGTPIGIVLLTAAVVNLRFVIYGLGMAPALRHHPPLRKLFLGYFSADLTFVLFLPRYLEEPDRPRATWLYLGVATGAWVTWQVTSLVGIFLAARIPTDWGLELAGALALLALVVPLLTSIPIVVGAMVAGTVGLVGFEWPMRLGIIGAVLAGVAASLLAELVVPPRTPAAKAAR